MAAKGVLGLTEGLLRNRKQRRDVKLLLAQELLPAGEAVKTLVSLLSFEMRWIGDVSLQVSPGLIL